MTDTATAPDSGQPLVLGPMLRYVGETDATVWVETSAPGVVTVHADGREWAAPTFAVKCHHYALVVVDGLEPGGAWDYSVHIDGALVWPEPDSAFPPPRIRTLCRARPTRLLFGSCRTTVQHDREGHRTNGVDALRTLALALARGEEAWGDEANRWLLSTVPSCMIFDDHDIRDDWNTSWTWHEEINRTSWWHERLMGGLSSYWVYQHIGNLSPSQLADDEIYARVLEAAAAPSDAARAEGSELDLTEAVFDLARRTDRHPEVYRWSYRRDLGDSRLVVVDSRAARVLEPQHRSMLDPDEMRWLDEQ